MCVAGEGMLATIGSLVGYEAFIVGLGRVARWTTGSR